MEAAIARTVANEQLGATAVDEMRDGITETITGLLEADRQATAQLSRQLTRLEAQEERLSELAADGTVAVPKLRAKLERTSLEKAGVAEKLELTAERPRYGAEKGVAHVELLREPGAISKRLRPGASRPPGCTVHTASRPC